MDKIGIQNFLNQFENKLDNTIVIVDYGNVEKWKHSLRWDVGIRELANLVKHLSKGDKSLRRFYYGADYGSSENSGYLIPWSKSILEGARNNKFEVVAKRVKYMHDRHNVHGFSKKCDLDVEMAVDLIKERARYSTIVLFSGDGDLMHALKYLHDEYQKTCFVFGARDHIGREVFDAEKSGIVSKILFAEDFEYRLRSKRFGN